MLLLDGGECGIFGYINAILMTRMGDIYALLFETGTTALHTR